MSPTEIKESLKELKLKGMLATFDSRIYEHAEAKQNLTGKSSRVPVIQKTAIPVQN